MASQNVERTLFALPWSRTQPKGVTLISTSCVFRHGVPCFCKAWYEKSQALSVALPTQSQGYRHWCNKLWNAIRFAMINLGEEFVPSDTVTFQNLPMPHRWILSRLNNAIDTVLRSFEKYEFSPGTTAMHLCVPFSFFFVLCVCMRR